MTSPYEQFETDENLERDGIVLDYGAYAVKIARSGGSNQRFIKLLEARQKPYRRQIQNETLDEGIARKMLAGVFAEAVILDWGRREKNEAGSYDDQPIIWGSFPGRGGIALPYTRDNVVKVLTDIPDFFGDIREQAAKAALFRKQEIEEVAGNSENG